MQTGTEILQTRVLFALQEYDAAQAAYDAAVNNYLQCRTLSAAQEISRIDRERLEPALCVWQMET